MNGQRDELKKFKDNIGQVSVSLILPELLQKDSVLKMETKKELLIYKNGKVVLSDKEIAKLILQYKGCGRISELSKLLISIQKKVASLKEESLCSDVNDACINLGWLETAHDILDDMKLGGTPMGTRSYISLLKAYHERKMFGEAEAFLKQNKKAGLVEKMFDGESDLAKSIIPELEEEGKTVLSVVYEYNSSIYIFWKAKMIGDALNTYRKMQMMKIQPIVQTFFNMVSGYSSLEMYREITILWTDIKRNIVNGNLVVNRDLFELLILNFIQGGYFESVMEVIGYMEHGMYIDKWMFKIEFL
ncbi:hypothetical protein CsSME_00049962 [Camellia sinensis var. sinensis]